MNFSPRKTPGFTLVELLVVIAILAVLASIGLSLGNKVLKKGKVSTMINNMKQIGPLFNAYANDHHQQLLPCVSDQEQLDGTVAPMIWHEVLLSMLHPEVDSYAIFQQEDWWDSNKSILRNPLFEDSAEPRGWEPLNPGYAYNIMLPTNYLTNENAVGDPETTSIPISILDEPARTPIIAPYDNYFYSFDESQINEFQEGSTVYEFTSEGKVPVLFLDGHIETIHPNEYVNRRLDQMPLGNNP